MCNKKTILGKLIPVILILSFSIIVSAFSFCEANAASLKISVNGTKKTYKGNLYSVKYKSKKINKSGIYGLKLNNNCMVPYDDIVKSGMGVKTSVSGKNIVFVRNDKKLTLTRNSKTAYLNGKKINMGISPKKVRYISKKKTKILVPIKYICNKLGYAYSVSGSNIQITPYFSIKYGEKSVNSYSYDSVVYYNNKECQLKKMPPVKIGSTLYFPAEELCKDVMDLEYEFNSGTNTAIITNTATDKKITITADASSFKLNNETVKLSKPARMVTRLDKNEKYLMFPAKKIVKALGFTYSWKSNLKVAYIHAKTYFHWTTTSNQSDANINYINDIKASYKSSSDGISFAITGSSASIMQTATAVRDDKTINITIPAKSKYALDKNAFTKFNTVIEKFEVTEDSADNVNISITTTSKCEMAYTCVDSTFIINVMPPDSSGITADIKILKPSNKTIKDVSNTDYYNSKKFVVTIKGNHVSYYKKNPVVISDNVITDVDVKLNDSGNTNIKFSTSKLQGYKITESGNYFTVKVGNPRKIYDNIAVFDAGHGGFDNGATHKGTHEKNINLKIMYTLMKDYVSANNPNYKVYWTRMGDSFVTLAGRAAYAKKMGADLFVSLHMNSASNTSANGTEVYYSKNNNSSAFSGLTSKTMATMFKSNLISGLGTNNRGVKEAGYHVIKHNTVPAVLIELGFLSGSKDYSSLTNSTFQKKAARIIYNTVNQIFNKYPTGR